MVSYKELQEKGELISSNASLHLWDEVYLYNEKKYQVMGTISDDDYIEISIIDE